MIAHARPTEMISDSRRAVGVSWRRRTAGGAATGTGVGAGAGWSDATVCACSGSGHARRVKVGHLKSVPRRSGRPPGVQLAIACVLLVFAVCNLRIPYYAITPGPTQDVVKLIKIDGAPTSPVTGRVLLTTVSLTANQVPVWYGMLSWFDASIELLPRSAVIPAGETEDDVEQRTTDQMEESQVLASAAALKYLGYDVKSESNGVRVRDVASDVPAYEVLRRGDIVLTADGKPVKAAADLRNVVGAHKVGDSIGLTVKRGEETVTVSTETVANPEQPTAPIIGVFLDELPQVELPLAIDIQSLGIGGPSAGLTFALGIVDLLDTTDIARKRVIAGTGEINLEGIVGPVGGVRQKVEGARNAGADVFLVPKIELRDACAVAGDLDVLAVETLKDAVDALRAAQLPKDRTCP